MRLLAEASKKRLHIVVELIYNVSRAAFPDSSTKIIFYDCEHSPLCPRVSALTTPCPSDGASHFYPRSPREDWLTVTAPGTAGASWSSAAPGFRAPQGWVSYLGHATFDESFAQEIPFSTSLYEVHQQALSLEKFSVTAEAARAQHGGGSGGTSGASVIPYLSLGAAYRPNTTLQPTPGGAPSTAPTFPMPGNSADFPFASVVYDVGHDPDLSYAALMGGLINQGGRVFNSTGYFSALGPWELADGAVFFPSVFETSCAGRTADAGAGGCVGKSQRLQGSTNLFDHFLSYVGGAHGNYTTAPA